MKRVSLLVAFLLINLSGGLPGQQGAPKPKRINKIIGLWEQGQPVYYEHSQGGYQEGLRMAQTWADYINYEMEHGLFDLGELGNSCAAWLPVVRPRAATVRPP